MKVWVPQAPKGAEAFSRMPHFDLPRSRVMLVFTLVSSMKTTRCGACKVAGNFQRNQWFRAIFTWGLRRSSSMRLFFVREVKSPQHDINA